MTLNLTTNRGRTALSTVTRACLVCEEEYAASCGHRCPTCSSVKTIQIHVHEIRYPTLAGAVSA